MDATNQPEKAQHTADSAQGSNNAASGAPQVESPSLVPEQGEPAPIDPAVDQNADAAKAASTALIISTGEPRRERAEPNATRAAPWRFTKLNSLAASLALALGVGAIAGTIATLGFQRALTDETTGSAQALKESVVRLSSEFAAFKASVEASAKTSGAQVQRLTERLDRADRAQVEPASRLAKLAEAVEKLERRAAVAPIPPATIPAASPVAAPRAAAAPPPDVTGSINATSGKDPGKDLARLPIVQGWVLHSVYGGTAIVQGRWGLVEVEVGDPLPGGGRIEAIKRDNGRWVVVTSRGVILTR